MASDNKALSANSPNCSSRRWTFWKYFSGSNSLIYRTVRYGGQKKTKKNLAKYLQIRKFPLPLHPQSEITTPLRAAEKKVLKNIFWKSSQKIWWFQKYDLSLHPLSPLKRRAAKKVLRKVFWKKFTKNLVVQKICLTFAPLSALKNEREVWKRFFDLLVLILREKV